MSVGESQSLGETLRRQGISLFEARVGRTAVSSECCLEMVMVMFYFENSVIAVFYFYNRIWNFRGRTVRIAAARLNKKMGCKSPRCRRCKCRGGLPLTKVSHWGNPRRQAGPLSETQVRRPTEMETASLYPCDGQEALRFCTEATSAVMLSLQPESLFCFRNLWKRFGRKKHGLRRKTEYL